MYKTIVVHIDGSSRQACRVSVAAVLAKEYGAHVVGTAATGISWLDFSLLTGSMTAPMPPTDFDRLRATAQLRLDEFNGQAARLGIESAEACLIDDVPQYGLLLQSRYADLVILSQDEDEDADADADAAGAGLAAPVRRLPEHVALHGARPVLVVPPTYRGQPIPGTVVVGWDGSLQAIRALAAALPLLVRADSVKLALINPDELSELHGEQPGLRTTRAPRGRRRSVAAAQNSSARPPACTRQTRRGGHNR